MLQNTLVHTGKKSVFYSKRYNKRVKTFESCCIFPAKVVREFAMVGVVQVEAGNASYKVGEPPITAGSKAVVEYIRNNKP